MLVLTRRVGERVMIGGDIVLTIVDLRSGRVRLGIEAPPHVSIRREELGTARPALRLEPPTVGPTPACVCSAGGGWGNRLRRRENGGG